MEKNMPPEQNDRNIFFRINVAISLIRAFLQMLKPPQNPTQTTKIVDVRKYFDGIGGINALLRQTSLEYSNVTIDGLKFDFTVVPNETQRDLRVGIHRSDKSDTDSLKISFLNPSLKITFLIDSDSFYLEPDANSKVITIPGYLIKNYGGKIAIKVERYL